MRRAFLFPVIAFLLLAGCDRGSTPGMVGHTAPDFTVGTGAQSVSLHQFRGQVVVLNFWATWCPPCVEEMPSLVAMQFKLKDRGVQVLAVSTDDDAAAYERFVRDRTAGLLTVRDAAQTSNSLYGTHKYPETYIIDRNGVLRRKFIGPVDWTKPDILNYLTTL